MSKKVQYPDGYIGVANDKAAAILARKPGHKIIGNVGGKERPAVEAGDKKEAGDKTE